MAIKFKCPNCTKPLSVKDELAGKRTACPACKKPIVIPAPTAAPADLEDFAAAALSEQPAVVEVKEPEFVEFECPMCGDPVKLGVELAGKNAQCPACRNIVKVPLPKKEKPKDWREIGKKGPTAALINLPEQLDDAWGTEIKGRVSRESLEEAGAISEVVVPVGWGGWIRRGLIAATVGGVVTLIVFGVRNSRNVKADQDVIASARAFDKELEKDPKKKLHPVLRTEIERADGLLQLPLGKVIEAHNRFVAARSLANEVVKDSIVDQDLFLIAFARAQFEMGGDELEVRSKKRIDWDNKQGADKYVIKEVSQTLNHLRTDHAKVIAIRELSSDLLARGQKALAISLATSQYNPATAEKGQPPPLLPQVAALVFAHGDGKPMDALLKPPNPKVPLDGTTRQAYAEGHARKGNLEEAKKLVMAPGPDVHKYESAIGVACIILTDKKDKDAAAQSAAPFVAHALDLKDKVKYKLLPWRSLQLCRAAYRIPEHAAVARDLGEQLPKSFKQYARLEWILAQLEKGDAKLAELVQHLPEEGPARGLAWIALGRHFRGDLVLPEADSPDGVYIVFAKIGQALGAKDAGK